MRLKEDSVPWGEGISTSEDVPALHAMLGLRHREARPRIDCFLLAEWTGQPDLVLDLQDTYHYHNLPNLIPILRRFLCCGNISEDVFFWVSIFCMHVKKTKKELRMPLHERAAIVNTLHGLLLGLYPFNMHTADFKCRAEIAGAVRDVLTSSKLNTFIEKHESLMYFSVMEYFCNVVADFCPVEQEMFMKNTQSRSNLNQVFETFRAGVARCMSTEVPMEALDHLAEGLMPVLFRQMKSSLTRTGKLRAQRTAIALPLTDCLQDHAFFESVLRLVRIQNGSCNLISQIKTLAPYLTFQQLQAVEALWENVSIHLLPKQILDAQQTFLRKNFVSTKFKAARTHIPCCLLCAMKPKQLITAQTFAFNCHTGELNCCTCGMKAMHVDLTGRVFSVRNVSYFLCPSCMRPRTWDGVGLHCQECMEKQSQPDECLVCGRKPYESVSNIVDVPNIRLFKARLCFHHYKSLAHTESVVHDVRSLCRDLSDNVPVLNFI